MQKLMNKLMFSCKRATALIVKREDVGLARMEKAKLFFHLLFCSACRAFEKQSELIDNILKSQNMPPENWRVEIKASDEFKNRIISRLK
jgi:hypothetical protein